MGTVAIVPGVTWMCQGSSADLVLKNLMIACFDLSGSSLMYWPEAELSFAKHGLE